MENVGYTTDWDTEHIQYRVGYSIDKDIVHSRIQ